MQVEVTEKKKVLRYAKRDRRPGEPFEMRDDHANLFIALRHVRPYQREDMNAEDSSADSEKPKRRYRRRDMQAE